MRTRSRFQAWYGRDEPPTGTLELRAGPVTAQLEGGDLRYVYIGGVEIVRRLYVAVRDANWGTVPGELEDLELDLADDHFTVSFDAHHREHAIDFAWHGTITGSADGTISYSMDGVAGSDFAYNRIGFCILHPPRESAGRPYRGETPDGPIEGTLPLLIAPQRIEDGRILALFPAVEALAIELEAGGEVRFEFEGDLFEMEDQRNWTDGSFKTYSTPLALGFPHHARAGQEIGQSVTVSVAAAPRPAPAPVKQLRVSLGNPLGRTLPAIGLGTASRGQPLSPREVELLRPLRPGHLRVDLHLGHPSAKEELERAAHVCEALGTRLELAVFIAEDADAELARCAALLRSIRPEVVRVLVFHEQEKSTSGQWVRLARERLGKAVPEAAFAGGTNAYFAELNRARPKIEAMDAVVYTINPQVHAFDEASLVETLEAQAETVRTARSFSGDLPIVVSPITLRPRFNPNATGPEPEPEPGELPSQVDPRQMSLFGAAWTVGSVKYLAESGAASLTYYETTGWRGLLETEGGSALPERFPSTPGMVFPLYHVFADLAEWKFGPLVECRSSDPLAVDGLALRTGGAPCLLLANMTSAEQRVGVGPLDAERVSVRRLNEEAVPAVAFEPERFRAAGEDEGVTRGELTLELAPYEVVRIDARPAP